MFVLIYLSVIFSFFIFFFFILYTHFSYLILLFSGLLLPLRSTNYHHIFACCFHPCLFSFDLHWYFYHFLFFLNFYNILFIIFCWHSFWSSLILSNTFFYFIDFVKEQTNRKRNRSETKFEKFSRRWKYYEV